MTLTYASAGAVIVSPDPARPSTLLLEQIRASGERQVVAPKGRIEGNESPLLTALREVGEEAGLHEVRYVAYLGRQSYRFKINDGAEARKAVDWFLFAADSTTTTVGEAEGFRSARWLPFDEAIATASHGGFRLYLERARDIIAWRHDAGLGYDDAPAEPVTRISTEATALLRQHPGVGLALSGSAARGDFLPRWSDLDFIAWGAAATSKVGRALAATVAAAAAAAGIRTSLRFAPVDDSGGEPDRLVTLKIDAVLRRLGADVVVLAGDPAPVPEARGTDLTTALTWLRDSALCSVPQTRPYVTDARRAMSLLSTAARLIVLALDPMSCLRLSAVVTALSGRWPASGAVRLLAAYDLWRRDSERDVSRVKELARAAPAALDELLALVASDELLQHRAAFHGRESNGSDAPTPPPGCLLGRR